MFRYTNVRQSPTVTIIYGIYYTKIRVPKFFLGLQTAPHKPSRAGTSLVRLTVVAVIR
jgi:hypothetical protein